MTSNTFACATKRS